MSGKKLPTNYLNQKTIKETLNMIKTLEERINTVMDKLNIIKMRIHRKKTRA